MTRTGSSTSRGRHGSGFSPEQDDVGERTRSDPFFFLLLFFLSGEGFVVQWAHRGLQGTRATDELSATQFWVRAQQN